jgi:UDP-GlcNAc:undecaprenyl-phosphate GlcNAc-1-phosphate transferase
VLLLLPRFTPRVPRWAEAFVPPRYRRRVAAATAAEPVAQSAAPATEQAEPEHREAPEKPAPEPVPAGLNGATAIGDRSRFPHRRKIGTPQ